ncbi:IS110 family transposase [Microscilla marina]|uniref:Transposase for n=1 Tax=Microscilla marina ATCC 23134 TaxID=313606 RepID=A1ZRV4_MICM2|nr:IS110 family transposase [Microscilla marina]EAY26842.1 transposase for [Microscilla marina ATCC 23134]
MKKITFVQVGIALDISKADFRACIMGSNGQKVFKVIASRKFSNNTKGFSEFNHWVQKNLNKHSITEAEYLMEATGVYHENLAWTLYEKAHKVIVVLPNQAKAFLKSEGIKSKTDKIDAQGLAKMVLVKNLRYWKPISPVLKELRTITRYYEVIQKELTQNYNRLHALEHSHDPNKFVLKQLKNHLKFLEKQKESVHQQILETTKKDEVLHEKMKRLTTIYGIGILTVAVVVAETNGFEL